MRKIILGVDTPTMVSIQAQDLQVEKVLLKNLISDAADLRHHTELPFGEMGCETASGWLRLCTTSSIDDSEAILDDSEF